MSRPEADRWLRLAEQDLEAVRALLQGDAARLARSTTFHAQQAAEKALKAVVAASGIRPPRTHDLDELIALLGSRGVSAEGFAGAGSVLNEYAVRVRYPDALVEPSVEDVRDAVSLAASIVTACTALVRAAPPVSRDGGVREPAGRYSRSAVETGLSQTLASIAERVVEAVKPRRVLLFGSRATGTATADSDVDLFVELGDDGADRRSAVRQVYRALRDREFALDVIVYTPAMVAERRGDTTTFLSEIEDTGVVLYEAPVLPANSARS